MGVAENKELVRHFYAEVWDRGNVEFAHEVFADDYRFRPDGKVAEIWNHRDDLGFMEQLGAPVYAGAAPETPPAET